MGKSNVSAEGCPERVLEMCGETKTLGCAKSRHWLASGKAMFSALGRERLEPSSVTRNLPMIVSGAIGG